MLRTYRSFRSPLTTRGHGTIGKGEVKDVEEYLSQPAIVVSLASLFFVCLSIAFAPSLTAQTAGMGALTGRVIDASGHAVANATVTATST